MVLGLYVSVPFCRTKCSYCNFASGVFSKAVFQRYTDRVCEDVQRASAVAEQMGAHFGPAVDSIYVGGGTPTVLDIVQLERLFVTISQNFTIQPNAEVSVECASGTLTPEIPDVLPRFGVNRVSLGVQSFVDQEAAAVGRLHNRTKVLDDIARLRAAGISNINIDLITGLPHQTAASWQFSLDETISTGAPHVSVYMLEVDEESRLGRELIAGGARYHAHFVPDGDLTADLYLTACDCLETAGIPQYEISNFAQPGRESRHNLKYWTRQPYLGFGVDAHSMLPSRNRRAAHEREEYDRSQSLGPCDNVLESVRFSTPDSLEQYVAGGPLQRTPVSQAAALEESFFLGLRLISGVDLRRISAEFGEDAVTAFSPIIAEFVQSGLLERRGGVIRLTPRGRLLSNEIFERFITDPRPAPLT